MNSNTSEVSDTFLYFLFINHRGKLLLCQLLYTNETFSSAARYHYMTCRYIIHYIRIIYYIITIHVNEFVT